MSVFRGKDISESVVSVILLLCFWIIITLPADLFSSLGIKNLIEHFLLGAFFAVLVTFVSPYPILTKKEIHRYLHPGFIFRMIVYIFRLCIDIVKSGIDVAKRVLRPTLLISPGIVEIETPLDEDVLISLNANSITLTPGTITIDAWKTKNGSRFLIHCISQDAVKDIMKNGGFVKRIQACFNLEGK
ncbi:Na+/H+ antiporter subunit E [bacterium]|nr:Na+/H+ antiporter subunit E [bacterium]